MGFILFSVYTVIIFLNGINKLIFVMVKSCVLFEAQAGFLNNIWTRVGFKSLIFVFIMLDVPVLFCHSLYPLLFISY